MPQGRGYSVTLSSPCADWQVVTSEEEALQRARCAGAPFHDLPEPGFMSFQLTATHMQPATESSPPVLFGAP